MTPSSVYELTHLGHSVYVEHNAGLGVGYSDDDYQIQGATIVKDSDTIFADAQMIVKVKEPQAEECKKMHKGQILFTFVHLAADKKQTMLLCDSEATVVAYEMITDDAGHLPILAPMSEVAGRISIQIGAHCLEQQQGGRGILLGGVPGVAVAKVLIIGGGVAGENAARIARGMGADVVVLDRSIQRLRYLGQIFNGDIHCEYSTQDAITRHSETADLIIGAVLLPGATAPKLITREHVNSMKKGSVLVDIAIDQGGCFATSHPTTHSNPTYKVDGVVHYCVSNIPSAVPITSTYALNNVTLPYIIQLAECGIDAMHTSNHLLAGLSIHHGKITCRAVAAAHGLTYVDPKQALGI